MSKFILGFILGATLTGGLVWAYAALGVSLQDAKGNAVGTTANPLYVTTN